MKSIAYVLLILGCFATDMVNDLFLRSANIAGTNPHSWDVTTSVGVGFGAVLLFMDRDKDKS